MKTLKQLLLVALIGLLMVSVAMAQEKAMQTAAPGPTTVYQAKFPITLQGGEYDLKTIILDFPQGAGVSKHVHGGHVLVTVLNGEITLKDKSGERIIKTGESWTENPGDLHSVVNAGVTEITYYALDKILSEQIQAIAQKRDVSADTLINLWLQEKLQEQKA